MSIEGSGENIATVPSLPGAPEQTYLFPKSKGHSRSVSHGGTPTLAGNPVAARPLRSAMRGHQRALSHGQIGADGAPAPAGGGHTRVHSRTDFILPPGHRERTPTRAVTGQPTRPGSIRIHSRQASRSDSIYTLRRDSEVNGIRRTLLWLMRRKQANVDERHLFVVPNHLVPDKTPPDEHPNGKRLGNKVRTTKYTLLSFLPKNLFEQFHRVANVYFIFIVLLNWVPALNAFGKEMAMMPVLFVLTVTAIKDLFEDRRRHISDRKINNSFCRVFKKAQAQYEAVKWKDVLVGDMVYLSNNEPVPADMVLLNSSSPEGVCFVDTCNLDGETNLKQRMVPPEIRLKPSDYNPLKFRSTVQVERPSTKIYRFNGTIMIPNGPEIELTPENIVLRDCTIKNTDFVEGIVVYAGHETKAMLNNGGPRYKASRLEKRMNTDVIWCVLVLLFLCCSGAVGSKLWLDGYYPHYKDVPFLPTVGTPAYEGLLLFWTYIIVLQVMIPVSLYVTIECTKLFQVYYIHQDIEMYDPLNNMRTECRSLNITEELGQISYLFTDKTGTLTENKMVFKRCTIDGVDYDHPPGPPAEPSTILPPIVTPICRISPNHRMLQQLNEANDSQHKIMIRDFLLMLTVCNTVVVSEPHVDAKQNAPLSEKTLIWANGNGTVRSKDNYSILEESRSTTPSPPPSTGSPFRMKLMRQKATTSTSTEKENVAARFEAESPDELALAETALAYGYELRKRMPDSVTLGIQGQLTTMTVLRVQQFDSYRKCMSVAIRLVEPDETDQVVLYVKGADTQMFQALEPMVEGSAELAAFRRTEELVMEYSRAGLRTLVLAKKVMSMAEWEAWLSDYLIAHKTIEGRDFRVAESVRSLESGLKLIGATGVEDRLQEDVPCTLRALVNAGIVVWVLTGDKPETAVNIAYSAGLFKQSDTVHTLMSRDKNQAESTIKRYLDVGTSRGRALVVDGRTLTYILDRRSGLVLPFLTLARRCSAVLCCRTTPLQKAYIVKAVKEELDVGTLAIGDGANDVSMIQTADVGVGLSGQEGRQAVMASDFALPRFKFIQRLLLVHGHWSYDRLARMILYFFYKNSILVFMLFWYQFHCGFSTTILADSMHWMFYNLIFTALPPFVIGIYDRIAPASLLMENPGLYNRSRRGLTYRIHSYWATLGESVYISFVIFFSVCQTYWDSTVDLYVFGTVCFTSCLVVALTFVAVETRSWTAIHVLSLLGSLLMFFSMTCIYQGLGINVWIFTRPSTYFVIFHTIADPKYWLLIVWVATVALIPRTLIHAILNTAHPDSLGRAVMAQRRRARRPYAATFHTTTASAHVYRSTDEEGLRKTGADVTAIT